jgi:hypothetical protein
VLLGEVTGLFFGVGAILAGLAAQTLWLRFRSRDLGYGEAAA